MAAKIMIHGDMSPEQPEGVVIRPAPPDTFSFSNRLDQPEQKLAKEFGQRVTALDKEFAEINEKITEVKKEVRWIRGYLGMAEP